MCIYIYFYICWYSPNKCCLVPSILFRRHPHVSGHDRFVVQIPAVHSSEPFWKLFWCCLQGFILCWCHHPWTALEEACLGQSIYITIHTHTYTYTHIHTHRHRHRHTHIHIHMIIFAYIHIHIHIHIHIFVQTTIYVYVISTCMCIISWSVHPNDSPRSQGLAPLKPVNSHTSCKNAPIVRGQR